MEVLRKPCLSRTCEQAGQELTLNHFYASKSGRLGRRAICKRCFYKRHGEKMEKARRRREHLIRSMPNTLTPEEKEKIYSEFNHACALSQTKEQVQLDHFVPLAWGKLALEYGLGGTTYENMLPLCSDLNTSKSSENPFAWIKKASIAGRVDSESWERVIAYVADKHEMGYWQFFNRVNSCYEHWVSKQHVRYFNQAMKATTDTSLPLRWRRPPYEKLEFLLKVGINVEVAFEMHGTKLSKDFMKQEETRLRVSEMKKALIAELKEETVSGG